MQHNTLNDYDTMMQLFKQKLAVRKVSPCGKYALFKYTNKVMYDYLWKSNPALLECRGHVYDMETKEIIQAAPRKSFNYLEDAYWSDVPLNTPVVLYKKFNGFMACMTRTKDGSVLITTTGSFDSDYVKMADDMLTKCDWKRHAIQDITHTFEIIHPDDPHIVEEKEGVKLLTIRFSSNSSIRGYTSPVDNHEESSISCILAEALELVKECKHEGYMMYKNMYYGASPDNEIPYWALDTVNVCKLKSPYYVQKKKLMRANHLNVKKMFNETVSYCHNNNFGFDFQECAFQTVSRFTESDWQSMNDQERRKVIESILEE
jgi:hypothetical protein